MFQRACLVFATVVALVVSGFCGQAAASKLKIAPGFKEKKSENKEVLPFVVKIEKEGDTEGGYIAFAEDDGKKIVCKHDFYVMKDLATWEVVAKKFVDDGDAIIYKVEIRQINGKGNLQVHYFVVDMDPKMILSAGASA